MNRLPEDHIQRPHNTSWSNEACQRDRFCSSGFLSRPGSLCFAAVLVATIFCVASVANAERAKTKGQGKVRVQVRTVMAEGVRHSAKDNGAVQVDSKIHDLSDKLSKLHYKKFVLIGSRKDVLSMQHKKVMQLGKGHTLALRPMYIEGNRVGMWLKWKDDKGSKLLDTRMHFTCGESVVTGTERSSDSGLILAIDVTPN